MNDRHFVTRVELDNILKELEKSPNHESLKRIISLYGIGGAGKTTLLDMVEEEITRRKLESVSFRINENAKYESLPEFVDALTKTFFSRVTNAATKFDKLHSEVQRYQKIAGKIESVFTPEERRELDNIKEKAARAAKKKGKRKFSTPNIKIGPFTINSGHYEGQELDGEAEAKVWLEHYDEAKKRIIADRYKGVEDQEYFFNPAPHITSTLLSCLLDSLYPRYLLVRKHNWDKKPLKVLFILDTYEKIGPDVSDWLLQFLLPQLQERPNKETFDARFIISGREQLSLSDHHRRWDKYGHTLLECDVHRFTKDQVKQYLEIRGLEISLVDEAYRETDGLAYLLNIWADTLGEGSVLIYGQAANRIFWWKSEEEKNWIKAASFCDYYDRDLLSIFLGIEKAGEAFEWLRECHEVTRTSEVQQNKCQLHPTVRKVVCQSMQQESDELFQDHTKRAKTYTNVTARFPNVSDRDAMLKLCPFRHFNQPVLDEIYPTEGFPLHNFAEKHKDFFDELKQTFKMKPELQDLFYRYYSWRDQHSIENTINKIKSVWQEKRKQIDLQVEGLQKQAADTENRIKRVMSNISSADENLQKHRIYADKQEPANETGSKVFQKRIFIPPIGLVFAIFGFFLVFAGILYPGAIRITLVSIGGVLLIVGLLGFISSRFRHASKIDPASDKGSAEDRRKSIEERTRMEKDRSDLESQKSELAQNLLKFKGELERYKAILEEPYI